MENTWYKEVSFRYGALVAGVLAVAGCASVPGWKPMEDVTPQRIARKEAVEADFERKYASIAILEAERLYRAGRYDQAEEKLAVALRRSPDDPRVLALARKLAEVPEGGPSLSDDVTCGPEVDDTTLDEPLPGEVVITSYEASQPSEVAEPKRANEAVRGDVLPGSAPVDENSFRAEVGAEIDNGVGTLDAAGKLPENVRFADPRRLETLVRGRLPLGDSAPAAKDEAAKELGTAKKDEGTNAQDTREYSDEAVEVGRQVLESQADAKTWRLSAEDRELLAAACEALQAGERQEGVLLLRELAARSADPVEAACRGALTAMEMGCPEAAVDLLSSESLPQNRSIRFYQTRALALWRVGRAAQAKRDLDTAISLDKRNPLSYLLLGCVQAELGQQREAEANFRLAVSLEPRYARYRLP